jgi:hypothetical protein
MRRTPVVRSRPALAVCSRGMLGYHQATWSVYVLACWSMGRKRNGLSRNVHNGEHFGPRASEEPSAWLPHHITLKQSGSRAVQQ